VSPGGGDSAIWGVGVKKMKFFWLKNPVYCVLVQKSVFEQKIYFYGKKVFSVSKKYFEQI
jgi:hypothetical protein